MINVVTFIQSLTVAFAEDLSRVSESRHSEFYTTYKTDACVCARERKGRKEREIMCTCTCVCSENIKLLAAKI